MDAKTYQELASRTDLKDEGYFELWDTDNDSNYVRDSRLVHAQLGLSSEVGEVADAIKKHVMYGQDLDVENLLEEAGDVLWYLALMLNALDVNLEDVMEANINKLRKRYPEGFTEDAARFRADKQ